MWKPAFPPLAPCPLTLLDNLSGFSLLFSSCPCIEFNNNLPLNHRASSVMPHRGRGSQNVAWIHFLASLWDLRKLPGMKESYCAWNSRDSQPLVKFCLCISPFTCSLIYSYWETHSQMGETKGRQIITAVEVYRWRRSFCEVKNSIVLDG